MESIFGLEIFHKDVHSDKRGSFREVYSKNQADVIRPCQINVSVSNMNVIRGIHIAPFAKLCTCISGALYDVVVDLRECSPTYLEWQSFWLTPENGMQVYIPAGCGHGFYSAKDETMLLYSQDGFYNPLEERSLLWSDPEIGIEWPVADSYIISDRDLKAPTLKDCREK